MPRYGIVDTGDTSGHPRDRERATEPTYRRSLPGGRDGARGDGKESPQPPSFVVYTEGVLRWLGVEGVTPEVLRRAKRGLQEKEVAAKMWRALLLVSLLHLDAISNDCSTPSTVSEPLSGSVSGTTSASFTGSGTKTAFSRHRVETQRGLQHKQELDGPPHATATGTVRAEASTRGGRGGGGAGVGYVSLGVAAQACGSLLRRWGYRRRALYEGIKAGDVLQTREILLALAWLLSSAGIFRKYEQASSPTIRSVHVTADVCSDTTHTRELAERGVASDMSLSLQSELLREKYEGCASGVECGDVGDDSRRPLQTPPSFPRDPSETPENARVARKAFLHSLYSSAPINGIPTGGGRPGGRMGLRKIEDDLRRALRAARELMCCYGRLEAELRVVEGLETARLKMLQRMHQLQADLEADVQAATAAAWGSKHASPRRTQDSLRTKAPPLNTTSMSMKGQKMSTTTPFLLCLLAKPEHEQLDAFIAISRARAALELIGEGRACQGKWCRWVLSALGENSTTSRQSSMTAGAVGPGCAFSNQPSSIGTLALTETSSPCSSPPTPTWASNPAASAMAVGRRDTTSTLPRHRRPPAPVSSPSQMVAIREFDSQGVVLTGLTAEGTSSASIVRDTSKVMSIAKERREGFPSTDREESNVLVNDTIDDSLHDIQPRVRALQFELENRLRAVGRTPVPRAGALPGLLRNVKSDPMLECAVARCSKVAAAVNARVGGRGVTRALEEALTYTGGSAFRRIRDVPSESRPHPTRCEKSHDDSSSAACNSRGQGWAWARPGELEDCRRVHRERLEGLLSACGRAMPLMPRGAGW